MNDHNLSGLEIYEYRIEKHSRPFNGENYTTHWLNGLGSDGWELCFIDPDNTTLWYFKRKLPSAAIVDIKL